MSYTDVGKVAGMFPTFARGGANQKPSDALIQQYLPAQLSEDHVQAGDSVTLPAVLLVDDGGAVTSDAAKLSAARVTAEIVEHGKGPKIIIHKFRNKTGYHKRQGHRQGLSTLRVTARC